MPSHGVEQEAFDQELQGLLTGDVPLLTVKELVAIKDSVYLFDTREREEFKLSHIPGARYLGYNEFSREALAQVPKEAPIVLYCSVGYRSERIGRKLEALGFTSVRNLYGSIFEWANQGQPLVDEAGRSTQNLHTYNEKWSQWVQNDSIRKIW